MTLRPAPLSSVPLVGLVVEPGEGGVLRPIVRALMAMVEVRSLGRCTRTPDLVLASGEAAAKRTTVERMAVCVSGGVRVGDVVVPVPAGALDVFAVLPRGPLVRRRWQEQLGRPDGWTVLADGVPPADRPEVLAVCSAAVVSGDDLALALALGTPVVTTAAAARSIGALDNEHVVVAGDGDDAIVVASLLAVDEARAAAVGAAGRRLAEAQLDIVALARQILSAAGLESGPGSVTNLDSRLRELHTPPGSRIRNRVDNATAALIGASA